MTDPRPLKKQKTSDPSLPSSVSGFTVLPIRLPSPLPSVPSSVHILYLRRHEEPPQPPAIAPIGSPRTIFVVNVPVDSTKELLRGLFASLGGRLEDVRIHSANNSENAGGENLSLPDTWDKRLCRSGTTAHITFPSSSDVDKILKSIAKERRNQAGAIREWGVGIDNPTSSLGLQRIPITSKN
jgi:ribosomal RNA-processing protein 7